MFNLLDFGCRFSTHPYVTPLCCQVFMVVQRVWINRFIILFHRTVVALLCLIDKYIHGGHLMPTTHIISLFKSVK